VDDDAELHVDSCRSKPRMPVHCAAGSDG
jgi:hypothetical protein